MKLIITGATGAAGLDILRAALADSAVSKVTVLSRRPLPETIPKADKLSVVTHNDFMSYPASLLTGALAGHSACIWALGKTSQGMTEADYTVLTRDWPVTAFKSFMEGGLKGEGGGPFRFVYVSGEGVDRSGKGFAMFSRVKGRAETDLLAYAKSSPVPAQSLILRPGYFFPSNAADARELRSGFTRFFNSAFSGLFFAVGMGIPAQDLGRVAVEVAKGTPSVLDVAGGEERELFNNRKMTHIAKELKERDKSIHS